MTIIPRKKVEFKKLQLDLAGSEGNAYVLMGYVHSIGKQLGMSEANIKTITKKMMAGDYKNLVAVFDASLTKPSAITST